MDIPELRVETLQNPMRYTHAQIAKACALAQALNRGRLLLVEPPGR